MIATQPSLWLRIQAAYFGWSDGRQAAKGKPAVGDSGFNRWRDLFFAAAHQVKGSYAEALESAESRYDAARWELAQVEVRLGQSQSSLDAEMAKTERGDASWSKGMARLVCAAIALGEAILNFLVFQDFHIPAWAALVSAMIFGLFLTVGAHMCGTWLKRREHMLAVLAAGAFYVALAVIIGIFRADFIRSKIAEGIEVNHNPIAVGALFGAIFLGSVIVAAVAGFESVDSDLAREARLAERDTKIAEWTALVALLTGRKAQLTRAMADIEEDCKKRYALAEKELAIIDHVYRSLMAKYHNKALHCGWERPADDSKFRDLTLRDGLDFGLRKFSASETRHE